VSGASAFPRVVFAQFNPADSPYGLPVLAAFFPWQRGVFQRKGENTPAAPEKTFSGNGEQQQQGEHYENTSFI
jgi:hypothetical protein